ncbi:unnamed protein product [Rhodiola kirilowii]
MPVNFVTVLLVILFCGSIFGLRTKVFSAPSRSGVSRLRFVDADADGDGDGICKSMVESRNYPCEEHTITVITQDGYILSMQRIPQGHSGEGSGTRPPVLLMVDPESISNGAHFMHWAAQSGRVQANVMFPHWSGRQ